MWTGLLLGVGAGLALAALCAACYRQGLRRGNGGKKTPVRDGAAGGEEQNALMKKYEAIMGYDPYGERV